MCLYVSSPFNDAKVSDLLCVIRSALNDVFCSVLYMYNVCPDFKCILLQFLPPCGPKNASFIQ